MKIYSGQDFFSCVPLEPIPATGGLNFWKSDPTGISPDRTITYTAAQGQQGYINRLSLFCASAGATTGRIVISGNIPNADGSGKTSVFDGYAFPSIPTVGDKINIDFPHPLPGTSFTLYTVPDSDGLRPSLGTWWVSINGFVVNVPR
jgi:hypothetical protein